MSFVITTPEAVAVQSTLVDAHGALLKSVLNGLDDGRIGGNIATALVHELGNVALAVAEKKTGSAFERLQAFVDEVQRERARLPSGLTRDLLDGAESAKQTLSGQ